MNNHKINEAGFTLIELLMVIAILGIILAGVTSLFTRTSRYHTAQEMMVETQQRIRAAKHLMVDEIRSAGCDPKGGDRKGFELGAGGDDRFNTDDNSIHFTRDVDNDDGDELYEPDGVVDEDLGEDIRYYRVDSDDNLMAAGNNNPGTLIRDTTGSGPGDALIVAENVVDLEFKYYDKDNTEIDPATMTKNSVLSKIRTVEVLIAGQIENLTRASEDNRVWEQQFRIRVRNL